MALAINDQVPAPTLRFNEGDTAVIRVHNRLAAEPSTHWHGILLPNQEAGAGNWQVDTVNPDKILTVNSDQLTAEQVVQIVEDAGFKIQAAEAPPR